MHHSWQPTAEIDTLKKRAQYLADARLFFAQRHVMEVDTPILSPSAPTAPYLDSFSAAYRPLASTESKTYYLHTSPEFAMKRLLAAGSGSIYQISHVFRNGEQGRIHSPEFTMLEWYRPELTLHQLMDEVNALLESAFGFERVMKMSYRGLFELITKLNVFECSDLQISNYAKAEVPGLPTDLVLERDEWLELIMSHLIEPALSRLNLPLFVYDFPASQAQLAKVMRDNAGYRVAARFELYIDGVELANGYDELLDAEELRRRFTQDNAQRTALNMPPMPIDEELLAAMQSGLPNCTGVALGLDRLIMLALKKKAISEVQTFSFQTAI